MELESDWDDEEVGPGVKYTTEEEVAVEGIGLGLRLGLGLGLRLGFEIGWTTLPLVRPARSVAETKAFLKRIWNSSFAGERVANSLAIRDNPFKSLPRSLMELMALKILNLWSFAPFL